MLTESELNALEGLSTAGAETPALPFYPTTKTFLSLIAAAREGIRLQARVAELEREVGEPKDAVRDNNELASELVAGSTSRFDHSTREHRLPGIPNPDLPDHAPAGADPRLATLTRLAKEALGRWRDVWFNATLEEELYVSPRVLALRALAVALGEKTALREKEPPQ